MSKKPPIDPFTTRKSRRTSAKKEREEKKLRLQQALAEIEEAEMNEAANKNNKIHDTIERIAELTLIIESAKSAYRELDDLVEGLLDYGETTFKTSAGETIELIDNFADKNKNWKSVPFNRFSVKIN